MIRVLLLLLALLCTPAIAFAGGGDDDDSAAADDDDDDDSADDGLASGEVPEENRVLGGGCDGQTPSGPYAALPLIGLAFGVTRIRRRNDG
ncbi:MAG: hypothetical protein GY898_18990 [Proteobacteria bacterium]|nr:hypothetical protein [Pseudomonadota bacterium]